jgi:site-specific recombinase XerD
MFLEHALAELLLAKDYTPMAATRRRQVLDEFISWAHQHGVKQVEELTRSLVRRYIADLRERPNARYGGHLAGETQHGRASVVRMFLNFCVREEWLDDKVTRHFEMPKKGKKVTPVFTEEHYKRLARAAEKCPDASTYLMLRDKALLALLFDTGIRAMEVCSLALDSVFIAPQERFIRVNGKGRAQREIGIGKQASLALVRYLNRGHPIPVKAAETYVFLNRSRCQLTPNAIDRVMHRLKQVAGPEHFKGIRVSAHTFRHSFAVHYLQQGGDLYKLSRLLGHESVLTTQRYLSAYSDRDARLSSASVLDGL